jgi:hypothetical protein
VDATVNAIIGQTYVPHLNDLGQHKIEAVNPTMVFYGFNIAEQPGLARVIAGKESLWDLKLSWPPQLPQFTEPVKEQVNLSGDGRFNITFSKTGTDAAGKGAATANLVKIECAILDVFFWCPATNKTIKSSVEKFNDETLASLGQDIWGDPGNPKAVETAIEGGVELLTKPGANFWPKITQILYRNVVDKEGAIKLLQENARYIKAAKVITGIKRGYDAANVYLPFLWDGVTKPNIVKYCVTETNGILSATCQGIQPPPDAAAPPTAPPAPPPAPPAPPPDAAAPPTAPPAPPTAPSDISVFMTSGGAGIGVMWADKSDNEDGFDIFNGVEHWQVVRNQTFLSSNYGLKSNQNDARLMSGQYVCFQVSAYNAAGYSAPTSWGCITTP